MVALGLGRRRRVAAAERREGKKNAFHHERRGPRKKVSKRVVPVVPPKVAMKDRIKVFTDEELAKLAPKNSKPLQARAAATVITRRWNDGSKTSDDHVSRGAIARLASGHAPCRKDLPSQWAPTSRRLVDHAKYQARRHQLRRELQASQSAGELPAAPVARRSRKPSHRAIMGVDDFDPGAMPLDDRSTQSHLMASEASRQLHAHLRSGRAARGMPTGKPVLSHVDAPPSGHYATAMARLEARVSARLEVVDEAIYSPENAAAAMDKVDGRRKKKKKKKPIGTLPPETKTHKPRRRPKKP